MTTARSEWRAGGPVVLGAALALGTALPAWNYVSSLFVAPLTSDFGWSRGQLATASTAAFLGSLAAPLVGKLADAVGARPVLIGGLLGYAGVLTGMAFQPGTLTAYTVLIALHTMIGIACGGAIFCRPIAGWFDKSRGFALGLTMTGVPLAAALITPLLQWTIESSGWRNGFLLLAGLAAFVGMPLTLLLVRERPQPLATSEAVRDTGADGASWPQIVRNGGFWLLALSLLPVNAAGTGLMSSMAPILTDGGMTPAGAASVVSAFAIAVIVARLAAGWLIDRLPANWVAFAVTATPGLGCLLMLLADGSVGQALLAVALIGVQQGAEIDLVGYLLARLFGMRNYASAYGVCVVFLGLSGAAGVAWFGRSYDAQGSYDLALALSAPCYLAGGLMLLALGRFLRPDQAARQ